MKNLILFALSAVLLTGCCGDTCENTDNTTEDTMNTAPLMEEAPLDSLPIDSATTDSASSDTV